MVYFGNIYIPSDIVNCEDYIQSCFDRRRVSIITNTSGVIYNCYISKETLQEIEFPKVDGENTVEKNIGSSVVFSLNEKGNPFIIGTIPNRDELVSFQQGEKEMYKYLDGCYFKIKGSAKDKTIDIVLDSEDSSTINIKSSGANSELNISSESTVNVEAETVNVKAGEELKMSLKTYETESYLSISEDEVMLEDTNGSKISLKDGKVTFNEGENGGMVNISYLTTKLNDLVSKVNSLVNSYNLHTHVASSFSAPTTTPASTASTASNFSENDFKDDTVIH